MAIKTYLQAINDAMRQEMERDENVFIIGEDVGKFGGCFGVTQGLFDKFGERRVRDTPITESAIVGAAAGAAAAGLRPIAELMFVDFIGVAMDQLFNQAAKMHYMFGGKAKVPMVLRMPQGAGVSAAAQHSQCLEAWFMHMPGIKVCIPSTPADAKGMLISAIRDDNPVVFLEHKLLYGVEGEVDDAVYEIPLGKGEIKREGLTYLFIGHDLSVINFIADRVCVMFLGHVCEVATKEELYSRPMHPYTAFLMDAIPQADPHRRNQHRRVLMGEVPSPVNLPSGCCFHTRCPYATERCRTEVPELRECDGRMVACHRAGENWD